MYCDGDRILHWSENNYEELRNCVNNIPTSDFTIFGRTNGAWSTHPESQRVTEGVINKRFGERVNRQWDVTAAARGMSKKVAQTIVECSNDDTFGVDVSWPILVSEDSHNYFMSYVKVDGLSFEGKNKDGDIDEWIHRAKVMQVELESFK